MGFGWLWNGKELIWNATGSCTQYSSERPYKKGLNCKTSGVMWVIEELFHISQCQEEGFIIPHGPLSLSIVSTRVGIEINIFSFNCNKHIAIQSSIYTQKRQKVNWWRWYKKWALLEMMMLMNGWWRGQKKLQCEYIKWDGCLKRFHPHLLWANDFSVR